MTNDEIRQDLLQLLEAETPGIWLLSYSIWGLLRRNHPDTADYLLQECGEAIGKAGGHPYGPISKISRLLANTTGVERQEVYTKGFVVEGIPASGGSLAIFRLTRA